MIVHHYYPHRLNIGDSFVRDGIRKLLGEHLPQARFVDLPVNEPYESGIDYGLRGENLRRSNAEADLIVIGGSNLYQCRKSGPWGVVTDADSIRQVRKPLLLIGLGTGSSFKDKVRPCPPAAAEQIAMLNRIALGSSVRDAPTAAFLDGLGVGGHTLTGCPATFVFDRPLRFNDSREAAVAFPSVRFRQKHPIVYWRLMRALKGFLRHCRDRGLTPFLSCHHPRDIKPARELAGGKIEVFYSGATDDYYARYERARLVAGFRLHASIISLSLGVPFIPVTFDVRCTGFARTYDSARWLIDGAGWGLLAALKARTDQILAGEEAPFVDFLAGRQRYRGVMRQFLADCVGKLQRRDRL